jgi:hypothetical protein
MINIFFRFLAIFLISKTAMEPLHMFLISLLFYFFLIICGFYYCYIRPKRLAKKQNQQVLSAPVDHHQLELEQQPQQYQLEQGQQPQQHQLQQEHSYQQPQLQNAVEQHQQQQFQRFHQLQQHRLRQPQLQPTASNTEPLRNVSPSLSIQIEDTTDLPPSYSRSVSIEADEQESLPSYDEAIKVQKSLNLKLTNCDENLNLRRSNLPRSTEDTESFILEFYLIL